MDRVNLRLIKQFFSRYHRAKLRACLRGHSKLKHANQFGNIRDLLLSFSSTNFFTEHEYVSKLVFGASHSQASRLICQYVLQITTSRFPLTGSILFALGDHSRRIVHPLPNQWQNELVGHGFHVNKLRSSLAWGAVVILYLGYGVATIAKLIVLLMRAPFCHETTQPCRYAYFDGLLSSNLPQSDLTGANRDICTWYSRWDGRARDIDAIRHGIFQHKKMIFDGISVEYIAEPYNLMHSFGSLLHYASWAAMAVIISIFDALRGHWWHAILLAEAAKAKAVELTNAKCLAADYLFHYSAAYYRPMWTYEAEKKGSRITCYFYSAYDQVKPPEGLEPKNHEFNVVTWPLYLVWDQYQADMLRKSVSADACILIVGPIWFADSPVKLQEIPERSIAVFDIQPYRKSAHFGFSTLTEYFLSNPNVHIQFLQDVRAVLLEFGITMLFKRKREILKNGVKKYNSVVEKLSSASNVIQIDPAVSALRVIEKSIGIISMPFTSTALYMRDQGIPSAYYDPTGWIQRDDRGAHGIQILSGIGELRDWVGALATESRRIDE